MRLTYKVNGFLESFTLKKILFNILLVITSASLSGCSVRIVNSNSNKFLKNARRIDLNEMKLIVEKDPNGRVNISVDTSNAKKLKIRLTKPCKLKYQNFYFDFLSMTAVSGKLSNGKKYTVLLDTGSPASFTNDLIISDNDFATLSILPHFGICYIPYIKIGQAEIENLYPTYLRKHWQVSFLGMPIWRQKAILLGAGVLSKFSYIHFDNIKKEVQFALNTSFEPNNTKDWDSWPFEIENRVPMVNIPIEQKQFRLMFDTCGSYGMTICPEMWQEISKVITDYEVKNTNFYSGFTGRLKGQKAKVKNLKIANLSVKNAEIIIRNEDDSAKINGSATMKKFENQISMKYFKDTIVVLDFQKKLIWIKK